MPELPEVERARRLVKVCIDKKITKVCCVEQGGGPRDGQFDDKVVRATSPSILEGKLRGRQCKDVSRKGKFLWLTFDNDTCLVIHFGMTGSLSVDGMKRLEYMDFKVDESWPPKYCKFEMVFDNSIKIAMTDARRLGRVELVEHPNPLSVTPLNKLGNDPIEEPMSSERFLELIRKRSTTLKALLLNQQMVYCGIGNCTLYLFRSILVLKEKKLQIQGYVTIYVMKQGYIQLQSVRI